MMGSVGFGLAGRQGDDKDGALARFAFDADGASEDLG